MIRNKAVLTLTIAAAPNPCNARAAVNVNIESDSAHKKEVKVNKPSPRIYILRYPHISPMEEKERSDIIMATWYAFTIQIE